MFDENGRKFLKPVENTEGKGEIARYEQFVLCPQCFQKTCNADTLKPGPVWERVNGHHLMFVHKSVSCPGFALSIAIVAKCDKKINVAQDFFIWRKCVAKTFCQVT